MIALITAMTKDGVIGKGNALPWNIPDELKYFRKITNGHTVIMGFRTFQSIGKPLPNRNNIVLSDQEIIVPGIIVCTSVDRALEVALSLGRDIFVIGGARTYEQFLPLIDRMYISYIKKAYVGDVYFPQIDWSVWKEIERFDYPDFEAVVYQR